ncbi:MAG TPA: helix-turn-helix transcriptional regulator [Sphingomicrobium sp.]|nr:helix-turn-helix transcriptional regulator [Sphingomicrobium sp.]
MVTRIREIRRARGFTLDEIARRCDPPTTPQTIGRLETGARTVSIGWLERIASAMGVRAQDLMAPAENRALEVAAVIGPRGALAPKKNAVLVPPQASDGQLAVVVETSVGEYRAGDEIWCEIVPSGDYARALNHDVLVPRSGMRLLFGRLINRDEEKLQILPLEAGARQQVVSSPPWLAVAKLLVRRL